MHAEPLRSVPRTAEIIALGLAIAVVLVIAISSYRDWNRLIQDNKDSEQARKTIAESTELLSSLKDAETGQRGFLLTDRPEYLEPYQRNLSAIRQNLDELGGLLADPKRMEALKLLVDGKVAELQQTIDLRRTKGRDAAITVVLSDRGKMLMDEIRRQCAEIEVAAEARVREKSAAAVASSYRTRLVSTGGSVVLLVLIISAAIIVNRATSRRQELIRTVQEKELETARTKDLLHTTLSSIGDAVIATDAAGRITFLNGIAQKLTAWSEEQAAGVHLDEVFQIVNETTRKVVESPVSKAIRKGTIVGLANHTVLIGKNGTETPIDDSAAPIWSEDKQILGVVLVFRDVSDRRQAERALEESRRDTEQMRDLLQTTLYSIGDGVITTDAAAKITFMNRIAEELTGWNRDEAHGLPLSEVFSIVDEATLAPADNPIEKALREERVAGLAGNILLLAKDGRKISIDDSAAPIREQDGRIAGAVLVFRDITERRKAVRDLIASETRFRSTFVRAPIGMVITDVQGRVIQSNQTYRDIVGYSAEELPNVHFLSLTHPDDVAHNQELFQSLLADKIPSYAIEKRILKKSGGSVWVRASATSFLDAEGAVQVIGLVEDIGKRKEAEAALVGRTRLAALGADTGAALTRMVDLPDGLKRCAEAMVEHLDATFARIWTLNPVSNVLELQASAGLYTHLDGPHSRIPVGSFKIGLIAVERQPHLTNDVTSDPMVSDQAWVAAEKIVSFAGYPLVVEDRLVGVLAMFSRQPLSPDVLNALGSIANNVAIGIERKRAEEDRKELLASEQAARRDAELSAQRLARSNEDLRQFAHAASHDLRSPLRTVNAMTGLLARRYKGKLDGEADELIGFITGGMTRMDSLISDLLAFSEIGEVDVAQEHVSMELAVKEALTNLHSALEESGAVVTQGELPAVIAHKTQLVQVVQNLIGNAIKYRSERPVVIDVSATRGNSEWVFAVRDNGIGIDPKYATEVFGAFRRLHGSEYPGNGIGLATCKKIVARYGGRIWVESEVGCGSTFFFTLPGTDADSRG